MALTG
ncbi:hypothetical protein F383_38326 [Gossypium arboreum]|jgi:hypothetical protein